MVKEVFHDKITESPHIATTTLPLPNNLDEARIHLYMNPKGVFDKCGGKFIAWDVIEEDDKTIKKVAYDPLFPLIRQTFPLPSLIINWLKNTGEDAVKNGGEPPKLYIRTAGSDFGALAFQILKEDPTYIDRIVLQPMIMKPVWKGNYLLFCRESELFKVARRLYSLGMEVMTPIFIMNNPNYVYVNLAKDVEEFLTVIGAVVNGRLDMKKIIHITNTEWVENGIPWTPKKYTTYKIDIDAVETILKEKSIKGNITQEYKAKLDKERKKIKKAIEKREAKKKEKESVT